MVATWKKFPLEKLTTRTGNDKSLPSATTKHISDTTFRQQRRKNTEWRNRGIQIPEREDHTSSREDTTLAKEVGKARATANNRQQ